jgi:hypothetical protein
VPLPWDLIKDSVNCTLTVKIGKQHLVPSAREEITSRRALWGTDIYTDDSDIVAACIHQGWIRGEWPEEVDVDLLDLYTPDEKEKKGRKSGAVKHAAPSNNLVVLDEPPKGGPMNVPENRDLHVTVLILPRLQKYASTIRFGIKSREFGGQIGDGHGLQHSAKHDGLSFMITGIRWVSNGVGTQNRLRGKARRERIRRALREVELGPVWAAKTLNVEAGKKGEVAEVQPDTPIDGDVALSGSWWKHRGAPPSERDKENQPAGAGVPDAEGPVAEHHVAAEIVDEIMEDVAPAGKEGDVETAVKEVDADADPDDTIVDESALDEKAEDDKERNEPKAGQQVTEKPAEVTSEKMVKETIREAVTRVSKEGGPETKETAMEAVKDSLETVDTETAAPPNEKPGSPKANTLAVEEPPANAPKQPVLEPVLEPILEPAANPAMEATAESVAEAAAEAQPRT